MIVFKQNQGTGNNRFDSKTQKPTGPDPGNAGFDDHQHDA